MFCVLKGACMRGAQSIHGLAAAAHGLTRVSGSQCEPPACSIVVVCILSKLRLWPYGVEGCAIVCSVHSWLFALFSVTRACLKQNEFCMHVLAHSSILLWVWELGLMEKPHESRKADAMCCLQ